MEPANWIALSTIGIVVCGGIIKVVKTELDSKVDKASCHICANMNLERHTETMDMLKEIREDVKRGMK